MSGPPGLPPESVVLQQFNGLRNTIAAERLSPSELERARNVDLDDAGQIHRRRGFTLKDGASYHSLFNAGTITYVAKDGTLGILNPDYTFTSLQHDVSDAPVAYVQVGEKVYFSSVVTSGVIVSGGVVPWGSSPGEGTWLSPVVNPTTYLNPVRGKLLGRPPLASVLAHFNGRIYLADGPTIWATELYLYDYVDKTKNYIMFEASVTMMAPVADGIYVGTEAGVWFLSGAFSAMGRVPVLGVGALRGSAVNITSDLVHPNLPSKPAILFLTNSGVIAGLENGAIVNVTGDKVLFPAATNVASMFRNQDGTSHYVAVTDSGGSPNSGAMIGDYVDAEIIRFRPS